MIVKISVVILAIIGLLMLLLGISLVLAIAMAHYYQEHRRNGE